MATYSLVMEESFVTSLLLLWEASYSHLLESPYRHAHIVSVYKGASFSRTAISRGNVSFILSTSDRRLPSRFLWASTSVKSIICAPGSVSTSILARIYEHWQMTSLLFPPQNWRRSGQRNLSGNKAITVTAVIGNVFKVNASFKDSVLNLLLNNPYSDLGFKWSAKSTNPTPIASLVSRTWITSAVRKRPPMKWVSGVRKVKSVILLM